jgi:branched-chain amino acid transport system ATP-binding protein
MTVLLSMRDIGVQYGGVRALDGVGIDIVGGTIHGLIGPNGAGKTTLLNVICRMAKPYAGSSEFEGQNLLLLRTGDLAKAGISRTFQNLALIEGSTVLENVLVGLHSSLNVRLIDELLYWPRRNALSAVAKNKAMEMLTIFGLAGHGNSHVGGLSYGQRKMVELTRATVSHPRLLLLDEPTAGLNSEEIEALQRTLLTLRERLGLTILVITHHIEFLVGMADQVSVLDLGKSVMHGTPLEVREDPRVIAAYIGGSE